MQHETETGPEEESYFDVRLCVICSHPFDEKNPAVSPDNTKLGSLFGACEATQDATGQKLLRHKNEILDGSSSIRYHRNRRATYTSSYHIKRATESVRIKTATSQSSDSSDVGMATCFTRSKSMTPTFNWKSDCFIYSEPCNPKRRNEWSMVRSSIDSKSQNLYTCILEAAKQKQDTEIITRLQGVPNGDLVAVEARYHRAKNCIPKYTDPRRVAVTVKQAKLSDSYLAAAYLLKDEFQNSLINEKQVVHLNSLKKRFSELAAIEGVENPDSYKSYSLKRLLKNIWPELSFIQQPGLSDLVCSSDITVGEALRLANELNQSLQEVQDEHVLLQDPNVSENDERIVHKAIGILRERVIAKSGRLEKEYYSSTEMTLLAQTEFVDPLLYKAIGWLSDETLFLEAGDIVDNKPSPKCLAIASDITTLMTSVISPKYLCISVHFHHDYGSRKLIEDLHMLGYGISYSELRHFLTSAAIHVSTNQPGTPSGGVIPPEIASRQRGGKLIVAAGDNWDHNERTVDGKRTTHAMTTILVSPQTEEQLSFPRIARSSERSIDISSLPGKNCEE